MARLQRMFPIATLVVVVVIGVLALVAVQGRSTLRGLAVGHHVDVRQAVALSQARQKAPRTVVFGDSIVESAVIGDLCGEPTLAAGVWGAKIEDLASFAPKVVEVAHPTRIVVAIGINDTVRDHGTDPDTFVAQYRDLISAWRTAGIAVDIGTLAPVTEAGPFGERHYDPVRRKALDGRIRALAAETSARVVPFDGLPKTTSGALPPDLSDDGVHLTAEGYRAWLGVLETAVCAAP